MRKLLDRARQLLQRALASDTTERAVKTFVQAAVAQLVLSNSLTSKTVVAAIASALSVTWNTVLQPAWAKFRSRQ